MSRRLTTILLIYAAIILIYALLKPEEINWTETFRSDDKIPFGTYVLFEEMDHILQPKSRTVLETPFYNFTDSSGTDYLYIAVNRTFFADELDIERLLDFVVDGNTAMIAATHFPQALLDTLDLTTHNNYEFTQHVADWIYEPTLTVTLACLPDTSWQVATRGWYPTFDLDSLPEGAGVTTLGTLEEKAAFIRYPYGEGAFYLHIFPYAFTNFYLLDESNHTYTSAVLSHLPEQQVVIWDTYYKGDPGMRRNLLGVLVQRVSFRWAYWLIIAGSLLFILFTAKRQQRPIPVIEPPQNSSVRFVRTLGDLYYQKGNHTDLAQKKLLYFKDYLKTTYLLELPGFADEEAKRVAQRTGRPTALVEELFDFFHQVEEGEKVTATQLTTLQTKLDQFFERTTHGE